MMNDSMIKYIKLHILRNIYSESNNELIRFSSFYISPLGCVSQGTQFFYCVESPGHPCLPVAILEKGV